MSYWTREHETLLNALQANAIVPVLYRRLSRDRLSPDDAEIRRLRDWPSSLRRDPGWEVLRPVLNRPAAWPVVWHDACEAGFSPRTDHHHALLFGRFCEAFVEAMDWESARWAWRECIHAWCRVYATDYPERLFDDLAPELTDGGADRDELLDTMLDSLIDRRVTDLLEASGAAKPSDVPEIDRRRLRFAWDALKAPSQSVGESAKLPPDGPRRMPGRLARLGAEGAGSVNAAVLSRFEKYVEEIDWAEAEGDALLGHFRWVRSYFDVVGQTEGSATTMISQIVDSCWALRRVGRDDIKEFRALLELGAPFNEELFERLKSLESAFGHNGRCADFLVFIGEKETDRDRRREIFGRGLEICPGHRNSAMLLSYEYLNEARQVLAQTALAPSVASVVPGTSKRLTDLVTKAIDLVDQAEEIYPYNESLPELREEVDKEAERLNVRTDDEL